MSDAYCLFRTRMRLANVILPALCMGRSIFGHVIPALGSDSGHTCMVYVIPGLMLV